MTVAELIKELEKVENKDTVMVYAYDNENDIREINCIDVIGDRVDLNIKEDN